MTSPSSSLRFEVAGRGARAPMLTVHGLVSSSQHWRAFVPHFRASRPVITWDYRGHGAQPLGIDPHAVGVTTFAHDARDVVAAAGQGPVVAVGLSFGVQVALELWRTAPESVRALVLICGTAGHPLNRISHSRRVRDAFVRAARGVNLSPILALLRTSWGRRIASELAYVSGGAHRRDCPRDVLDDLFAHVGGLDPVVASSVIASYLEHDAHDVLSTITVPTLIVAGDRDQLTPVVAAERMRDAIRGSELVVFPGRTHLAQVEDPSGVHAAIDAFLTRHAL